MGKTSLTINLAISLKKLGYEVIVFDADIGFANADVISGITSHLTVADIIYKDKDIFDVMIKGPEGIKIIAGGSGIKDIMQLDDTKLKILTTQLMKLENCADFILIDTGAGLSNTILNFINSAHEIILVITPEPTSLTDGYAMIKALSMYNKKMKLNIIVNRVKNSKEAFNVYQKLEKVTERFLNIKIYNSGYIYDSKYVSDSIMKQNPFVITYPNTSVTRSINNIALKLLGEKPNNDCDNGIKKFIYSITNRLTKEDSKEYG